MDNFRWFLRVYYVFRLPSQLAAIGAKLIAPTVASKSVSMMSLMNRLCWWNTSTDKYIMYL